MVSPQLFGIDLGLRLVANHRSFRKSEPTPMKWNDLKPANVGWTVRPKTLVAQGEGETNNRGEIRDWCYVPI